MVIVIRFLRYRVFMFLVVCMIIWLRGGWWVVLCWWCGLFVMVIWVLWFLCLVMMVNFMRRILEWILWWLWVVWIYLIWMWVGSLLWVWCWLRWWSKAYARWVVLFFLFLVFWVVLFDDVFLDCIFFFLVYVNLLCYFFDCMFVIVVNIIESCWVYCNVRCVWIREWICFY